MSTTPQRQPIRILVVDDHPMWRTAVRADLDQAADVTVVGEAGDGHEALDRAHELGPDVVLMDLSMPGMRGSAAIHQLTEELPGTRVLVLSASAEEADVLEAVKLGAGGYLLKSATGAELLTAVRQVAAGEPVFSPSLAAMVLGEFRRLSTVGTEPGLTRRETEVLRLVARGYTYPEIAEQLVLSVKTVQNHVQHILDKLQLRRRHELMRYAIRRGLDRDTTG